MAVGCFANTNAKGYSKAVGFYAKALRYFEEAMSAEGTKRKYSHSFVQWHGALANATPVELFLRGTSANRCVLAAESAFSFDIDVVMYDNVNDLGKSWKLTGAIKRKGNVTRLVGAVTKAVTSIDTLATKAITAFADAGSGNVTVTSAAHGLVNGQLITISGTTSYNGDFTVANATADTFTIVDTWVADDATGTWVQNCTDPAGWDIAATADDTNEALVLTATGSATATRVKATGHLNELAF